MSKISNVITMLNLLSTGRKYTIEELSNLLEVTPRMIRFYKEELEKAGIYIDTIMGPYGGYVLKKPIKLPERKISKKDLSLLEKYIQKYQDPDLIALKEKIMGIYHQNKEYTKNLNRNQDTTKVYNTLMRAIKERRKVEITYHSFQKGNTVRIINPAEMFLFQNGWYCAAFCELRKDFRHFELKRIINLTLLKETF